MQAARNLSQVSVPTQGHRHHHWHILFYSAAGYPHLDSVPYTSAEAAQAAIRRLPWAPHERPRIIRKDATRTCGGAQ